MEMLSDRQTVPWSSFPCVRFSSHLWVSWGFFKVTVTFTVEMCTAGWRSCLLENQPKNHHSTCPLFHFTPSYLIYWCESYQMPIYVCLSIVFLEDLSLCWQHWWWGPGLGCQMGLYRETIGGRSVTCEQELMPALLKVIALLCVFMDLCFPC